MHRAPYPAAGKSLSCKQPTVFRRSPPSKTEAYTSPALPLLLDRPSKLMLHPLELIWQPRHEASHDITAQGYCVLDLKRLRMVFGRN